MKKLVWMLCATVVLTGCVSQWPQVKEGLLITPGAQIEASDGSFFLWSGEPFTPPFQSWTRLDLATLTPNNYRVALRGGARQVKVMLPGVAPLYGILALEPLPPDGALNGRGYQIDISPLCAGEAAAGTPCVVHETVESRRGPQWIWALWLSNRPFR